MRPFEHATSSPVPGEPHTWISAGPFLYDQLLRSNLQPRICTLRVCGLRRPSTSPLASKSMPPWSGEPESGWLRKWQPRTTQPSFPASMMPIVPAGACQPGVEHAVGHPRPAREVVGVRRGVVRVVVVAEHAVHERVYAAHLEAARTLVRLAVAHHDVPRVVARHRHARRAAAALRARLVPPLGDAVRVEAVLALDVVREAALDEDVAVSLARTLHREARARVAEDEVVHHEVRRAAHPAAPVVEVAVAADPRTHPLAVRADLRPVLRRTARREQQVAVEHAPALQQQALARAEFHPLHVLERAPGRLRREAVPRVVARVGVEVPRARGLDRRVPHLRREVGSLHGHEHDALPGLRELLPVLLDREVQERETVRARIDVPLERTGLSLVQRFELNAFGRDRHAVPALRHDRAGTELRADVEEIDLQRGGRADMRHQLSRAEHAEGEERPPLIADAEIGHGDDVLRPEQNGARIARAASATPDRLVLDVVDGERHLVPVPAAAEAIRAPQLKGHLHGGAGS